MCPPVLLGVFETNDYKHANTSGDLHDSWGKA